MFLQLCEEEEVNQVLVITSAEQNEGPRCLPKSEIRKDCGATLWGFRVRGFASTKAKHQHKQQLPKLRKVTSTSGILDFGISSTSAQTTYNNFRKCKKGKVGPSFRGFGVRNFVSSSVQKST
jgi:hypothetical protein